MSVYDDDDEFCVCDLIDLKLPIVVIVFSHCERVNYFFLSGLGAESHTRAFW